MAPGLAAYLAEAERRPFAWGTNDCFSFPADWVLQRTGRDPLATFRGRYRTKRGADRKLAGLRPLEHWTRELDALGFEETLEPQAGDVGIVALRGIETGAIRTERRWAMRTMGGLASLSMNVRLVRAWRI